MSGNDSKKTSAVARLTAPGVKAPYGFVLPTLVDEPPAGAGWVHEIKLDGYRVQARIRNGKVSLITRNDKDYTSKCPAVVKGLAALGLKSVVLDGEVVVEDERGKTDFQLLQNAMAERGGERAVFVAFDVLEVDGRDLRRESLLDRKRVLEKVVGKKRRGPVTLSRYFTEDGDSVYRHACQLGLEGIVSKRADSTYSAGRSKEWVKVKCHLRQELVIGGWTKSTNSASPFGALLAGYFDSDGRLRYAGKIGTGFSASSRRTLAGKFSKLAAQSSPFFDDVDPPERKQARWHRRVLVGEVEFTEWTRDGRLRHPSFQGLREDKPAKEVVREVTKETNEVAGRRGAARQLARSLRHDTVTIGGVEISYPDRTLFPESEVTKRAAAEFFYDHRDVVLPFFSNRPLVLVRCPDGGKRRCFFQKHASDSIPDDIPRISLEEDAGPEPYLHVQKIEHVLMLVQLNVLEFHSWGSTVKKPEAPNQIVFDLDPAPDVSWQEVVRAARDLRKLLQETELESLPKTTGGKGLHVVVPIAQRYSFEQVKDLSQRIALGLSERFPGRFTTNMSKSKRGGKIFVDYLRNGRGASAILPFSFRARPGNPIALPLTWDQIGTPGNEWTLDAVKRHKMVKDPWQSTVGPQSLTKAVKRYL